MTDTANRAIAIVGLGAVLPDAPNVATFWQNILDKRYSIREVPTGRWGRGTYYDPDPRAPDKSYSNIGGWVRDFEFDWKQFRIPPKVVDAMDQSQQWALTIASEALADYGYPDRPLDTERTAVIMGAAMGGEQHYLTHTRVMFPEFAYALEEVEEWQELPADLRARILERWHQAFGQAAPGITEDSMPGELANIISGRVANVLNLRGPSFTTDAACASSFAAIEAAVELLLEGRVDAVITGGVDRNMGASTFVKFCKIGALSATGTRPFGDGADGFVMGEGAAAFLLKRLSDAEADGDKIYAVIRGVGGASDGRGKGITAPNPIGQKLAMERAWAAAGLDPRTATLVEAHGTSTRVGDVAEVESLNEVFGGAAPRSIGLGSVKSNIGHLKAGAGAAGLLKAALALHHRVLPPTLNAEKPNPNIDFSRSPFFLVNETRPWTRNGAPRRCGVSAYGFGGTNFHLVLEEFEPGRLAAEARTAAAANPGAEATSVGAQRPGAMAAPALPAAPRGILALGAATPAALKERVDETLRRVQGGWTPPVALPENQELTAAERLVIDFGDPAELVERLEKARKLLSFDNPQAWQALEGQGIFRGSGDPNGCIAFLFPGQGSQYVNMGRELVEKYPVVAEVFAEADAVMTPILGRPLTAYIFVDPTDRAAINRATFDLMQTEITQPAMLTMDIALLKLLAQFGFAPDMVMGHSLGEYAALIAAGILPFAEALEAAAARGGEMSKVSMADNGKMAAVLATPEEIDQVLAAVDGYVVPANINSYAQCVIGGASAAVDQAVALFEKRDIRAFPLPVSHAFHTEIVAPASGPLRQVLDRMHVAPPQLPLVANVTGDFYPETVEAIKDNLERQIAAPVQWVKGLQTLHAAGVRTFVEVGPKRALRGFVRDVFKNEVGVTALLTNHPKVGALPALNQALCGLYAAGFGRRVSEPAGSPTPPPVERKPEMSPTDNGPTAGNPGDLARLLAQALQQVPTAGDRPYNRAAVPQGSVVISGTGLGLPGAEKPIMDPDNALRILRGEQFIDLIPERFRQKMVDKHIVRLVKGEDGSGSFATIDRTDEVVRLAGRPGSFDLAAEYGVPKKLVDALDITTQLAMAAGLDALREAGIPLVMTYKKTTTGKHLPEKWALPEALRDETGVIFASAFPGGDRFANEFQRYYTYESRREQLAMLEELRQGTTDEPTLAELKRRADRLREALAREPYLFDRRFLFRVLAMGHSQFAQYIGARGPNTQINAACASTAQAVAIAEDWIRTGRCRRVIVIGADAVTSDSLMEWVGAGFLAVGAVTTEDRVDEAALPFDRRRHGTILGMGACSLVVESEDAVRERGMRAIVELLNSETNNSAFHGTRLDVEHIAQVLNNLISGAEQRFGLQRHAMAAQTVFMSHETFTPARGGSAAAEVTALRHVFGESAGEIVVANTKGFTGHPMGVGIEDVIAIKILEHGIVPPVPNFKEVDPDLGRLTLSRGGRYPVSYAIHLAAGFGSQISFTLLRRIPGGLDRVDNRPRYQRWLDDVSGYSFAEVEVEKRVLRVVATGAPQRPPAPSPWTYGTGPTVRAIGAGSGEQGRQNGEQGGPNREQGMQSSEVRSQKWERRMPAEATGSEDVAAVEPRPVAPVAPEPAPNPVTPAPMTNNGGPSTPETAPPPAPPSPTLQSPPPSPGAGAPGDTIAPRVLALVAEQTGYPTDMLDLDLDLEADLGIDTVKQAETFAAIRAEFDIPRLDDLNLRDYNTLEKVIAFVHSMTGSPASPQSPPPSPGAGAPGDTIAPRVLALVAEQTGYPTDMLDLDLDLEADLGIDTVKQAETFAAIRAEFDIPRLDDLNLRDYNTLEKVIAFVHTMTGSPASPQSPPPSPGAGAPGDTIAPRVLALVAEQTGYPTDMLDLDLDLEADLGIDTVKQAETFAAIRAEFDIPRLDDLNLRDYNTLEKVIAFVHTMTGSPALETDDEVAPTPQSPAPSPGDEVALDNANRLPRRVPVPLLRPALELCKATGVILGQQSRVVVALDEGGVGQALVSRLEKQGAAVLAVAADIPGDTLAQQLAAWLAEGPIQGVYWLTALDVEPGLAELDLATWRELNRRRVKNLSVAMRVLYDAVAAPGTFLISATRLGGLHGYGAQGATAPLGGAVSGFAKAYKRERPDVLVKVVDFAPSRKTAALADCLLAETERDPGALELGYWRDQRYAIGLEEQPVTKNGAGLELGEETVFLVTGAAGGITSAIVADLAAASGGIFYLLDLVAAPPPDDPLVGRFRQGKDLLKQELIAAAQAAGERLTPVQIEKQIMAVERRDAARRAIEAVERAGGTAHYHSVDLLDGPAVTGVVDDIRATYGRIDVLIHAGGVEISKALNQKDEAQFDLVFDIKADGFFSLLKAAVGLPIGATVVFSSVAGRFGNGGQTDYSAANDLLCKLSSSLRQWRPETCGIAIDWTAWAEIGMATRGSVPTIMKMAGIDMLSPEVGIPTVRRELTQSPGGEIVAGGELGMLVAEWDDTGGLDPARAQAWLEAQNPPLVLLGKVQAAGLYGGLEVKTRLDPAEQPFLHDHAMAGTPLLPGVMGTEAFAELAHLLAPGFHVGAVLDERFDAAFKFYRDEAQTLYLNATATPLADGTLLVRTSLRSRRELANPGLPPKVKEHFSATVLLTADAPEPPSVDFDPPAPEQLPITAEAIYAIYFHGPAYQVLEGAQVHENRAVGLLRGNLPPNSAPVGADLLLPRLIEACFQTAGVWEIATWQAMALPSGLHRVTTYARPAPDTRLYAVVEARDEGRIFDARVVDDTGRVYVELQGYTTVQLPGEIAVDFPMGDGA